MATMIADTACIDPRAEIAEDVEVGPYCVIGPEVKIGRGSRLIGHVCIHGDTTLGEGNVVHPFSVLGGEPQDVHDHGVETRLVIGDDNIFREGVTVHRGTLKDQGLTQLGSHNLLMANAHIAHDCIIGDRVIVTNNTMMAGHCLVESNVIISGGVGIHPFVSIGAYSYIGAMSRIIHDVPRYMLVDGNPCKVRCINVVGLKRHGISPESITALHEAHRLLYRVRMTVENATEILKNNGQICAEVRSLLDFISVQQQGRHGRARERRRSQS
jgi:UDP-N-acetylglucosamine acyltransferase